jgi:hypothetical protein
MRAIRLTVAIDIRSRSATSRIVRPLTTQLRDLAGTLEGGGEPALVQIAGRVDQGHELVRLEERARRPWRLEATFGSWVRREPAFPYRLLEDCGEEYKGFVDRLVAERPQQSAVVVLQADACGHCVEDLLTLLQLSLDVAVDDVEGDLGGAVLGEEREEVPYEPPAVVLECRLGELVPAAFQPARGEPVEARLGPLVDGLARLGLPDARPNLGESVLEFDLGALVRPAVRFRTERHVFSPAVRAEAQHEGGQTVTSFVGADLACRLTSHLVPSSFDYAG